MPVGNRAQVTIHCEASYDSLKKACTYQSSYKRVFISTKEVKEMDLSVAIAARKGNKSGSLQASYSQLQRKESEKQYVTEDVHSSLKEYNENHYQVYLKVTTTFTDIPSYYGREDAESEEVIFKRTTPKQPTTDELTQICKEWMLLHYDTDAKIATFDLEPPPFAKWVSIKRGEKLPAFAVRAGNTKTDGGDVYVGRTNKIPGKINTDKNRTMWNCWVHGLGSNESGEILVTNMKQVWTRFKKNEPKATRGLVGDQYGDSMRTDSDGMVVVARTNSGEPGKLNFDNDKYWHLWTHNGGKSTSGEVLILEEY